MDHLHQQEVEKVPAIDFNRNVCFSGKYSEEELKELITKKED